MKPLYLSLSPDKGVLFCSEIRPLLNETEAADVLLLPPGHMLAHDFCRRHYTLPSSTVPSPASTRELDRILSEAVRVRLPPNLPVATLFSGGIDSTLVTHYARLFRPAIPGYIAVGRNAADYVYARRYADETGFDLREVSVEAYCANTLSLVETVVDTVEAFEPAVIRPSLHTYLVSQRIHQDGFRVALCGEGADELFAGYSPLEYAFTQPDGLGHHVQKQCLNMMHRANLQRIDRCSMQFQLEIREPFLDQLVVGYATGLDKSALVKQMGDAPVGKAPCAPSTTCILRGCRHQFAIGKKWLFMRAPAAMQKDRVGLICSKRLYPTPTSTTGSASFPILGSQTRKSYFIYGPSPPGSTLDAYRISAIGSDCICRSPPLVLR